MLQKVKCQRKKRFTHICIIVGLTRHDTRAFFSLNKLIFLFDLLSTALQSQKKVNLLLAPLMISRNFISALYRLGSMHAVSVIRSSPGPLLFAVWSQTSPVQKILKRTISVCWMTRPLSSYPLTNLTPLNMLAPSLVVLSLMIVMCTTVLALHMYYQKRMSQPRSLWHYWSFFLFNF